jgi:hypothetical protein
MSRLDPLWTAAELNAALNAADEETAVALLPDGRIEHSPSFATILRDAESAEGASEEEIAELLGEGRKTKVTVSHVAVGPKEFEWSPLRLGMPAPLSLLSIDPERYCWIEIESGAYSLIGPFFDFPCPLWEWLVRAATAGTVMLLPGGGRPLYEVGLPRESRDPLFDPRRMPLPSLVHEPPRRPPWLRATLENFDVRRINPTIISADDAIAVSVGLSEMHDFAGQSHDLAQSIEGRGRHRAGDYWHAIHHRREPDPANAKYWCRKVGHHPVHETLAAIAKALISDTESEVDQALAGLLKGDVWDAFAFVDLCARAAKAEQSSLGWVARKLQFMEMTLLLASAYRDATTYAAPAG